MSYPSVMVIGGSLPRATLSVVRTLGRRGIPVFGGDSRRLAPPAFSRYTRRWFSYPSGDAAKAHDVITAHVNAWRPAVLLPVGNQGWAVILRYFADYAGVTAVIPSPGWDLFERLRDKATLAALAEEHEVPVPLTFRPQTHEEALALRHRLPYPVLLKPRASEAGVGIVRADDQHQLTEALTQSGEVPLIQQYVDGEDLDLTLCCVHGRPVAVSTYVTLRKYPEPYGVPVACRTTRDDELIEIGTRFLGALRYHGVANLDFRRDRRDGRPKLLDFNPRLAGTTEVSVASGVDLPWVLYRLALGEEPQRLLSSKPGVEVRWPIGEFQHLLATRDKRSALRALWRWRRVATNVSLADPLPHLAEAVVAVHRSLRRTRWFPSRGEPRVV